MIVPLFELAGLFDYFHLAEELGFFKLDFFFSEEVNPHLLGPILLQMPILRLDLTLLTLRIIPGKPYRIV